MPSQTTTQKSYDETAQEFAKNVADLAPLESIQRFVNLLNQPAFTFSNARSLKSNLPTSPTPASASFLKRSFENLFDKKWIIGYNAFKIN